MSARQLRDRLGLGLPGLQFLLLSWALHGGPSRESVPALVLLLLSALFGGWRSLRHARLIADTPTARIASAAQGYAELRGRGLALDGQPLCSPLNGLPVLWWRLQTEKKDGNGKWRHESREQSSASFLLEDDSGRCLIDPEDAEMLVRRREVTVQDEHRYTLWTLLAHDSLYVLGDFRTLGSALTGADPKQRMRERLEAWKADPASLLARFDLDGNREIDLREWELARAQARRETQQEQISEQIEAARAPDLHVVAAPADGRLYLISDLEPGRIARRFKLWAAFHLLLLLAAAAALGWLAQTGIV